jgi:hypothetical protein
LRGEVYRGKELEKFKEFREKSEPAGKRRSASFA